MYIENKQTNESNKLNEDNKLSKKLSKRKSVLGVRKIVSLLMVLVLVFSVYGCKNSNDNENEQNTDSKSQQKENETPAEVSDMETTLVRVGSLKGPTSIGLVYLMNEAKNGNTKLKYDEFTVVAAADELTAKFVSGDLDIILVPANVASVLYNKTNGGVRVLDINTLGVLYMVTGSDGISSMTDLKGKTIYLTGKGTTPDYVLQYLLEENGIGTDEVTLEYRSEATEVAALLAENPEAIGLLPQPFVTVACSQNEELSVALDMTKEWEKIQGENGGQLVTGVTIARSEFVNEHPEIVEEFIKEHKESTEFTETNLEETADFVVELGIIAKAPIAVKAIPQCNIVCITGEEMKTDLGSYLNVLYGKDKASVGGELPAEDFYYIN